jgi:RNA polymerase sigma factor (sigma-70 family)
MPKELPLALVFSRAEAPQVRSSGGGRIALAPADRPREDLRSGAPLPHPVPEFERALREHFSAAHRLARWLTRTQADAEDALQDAALRAFRSFDRLRPTNPRAWLLRIVRNCCLDLRQDRERAGEASFEEDDLASDVSSPVLGLPAEDPEARLMRMANGRALEQALRALAAEYREVFLLREVEGLSYKEIADVAGVPIGTVMSRLSRARGQLRLLIAEGEKETA